VLMTALILFAPDRDARRDLLRDQSRCGEQFSMPLRPCSQLTASGASHCETSLLRRMFMSL